MIFYDVDLPDDGSRTKSAVQKEHANNQTRREENATTCHQQDPYSNGDELWEARKPQRLHEVLAHSGRNEGTRSRRLLVVGMREDIQLDSRNWRIIWPRCHCILPSETYEKKAWPNKSPPKVRAEMEKEQRRAQLNIEQTPLSHAEAAEEQLLHTKKLEVRDRERLAKNLGQLAHKTLTETSLRQIFIEAFGDVSGESLYKKRKTILCLPNEAPASKLRTQPKQYLQLFDVIAKHSSSEHGQERRRKCLLCLVEGTSFDYQAAHRERFHSAYQQELDRALEQVVSRIDREVDLNWMRAWCGEHSAFWSTGDRYLPEAVDLANSEAWEDDFNRFLMDGWTYDDLPPVANVATVFTRFTPQDLVIIKRPDDLTEKEFCNMLVNWSIDEGIDASEAIERISDMFTVIESDTCVYQRTALDLEIRYDTRLEKWKPVIIWRARLALPVAVSSLHHNTRGLIGQGYLSVGKTPFGSEENIATDAFAFFEPTQEQVFVVRALHQGAETWQVFCGEVVLPFDELMELNPGYGFEGAVVGETADFYSLCFSPLLRRDFPEPTHVVVSSLWIDEDIDDRRARGSLFTPAPRGSIADHILKNLAYGDRRDRLDIRLLENAKIKYNLLKGLQDRCEREYSAAMEARFYGET